MDCYPTAVVPPHSTEPAGDVPGLPVRTLRVEVLSGPDAGLIFVAADRAASSETSSVGTAEGNDVVLSDKTVSRFHLELVRGGDGVHVVDHGSTNGTLFHGARLGEAVVPPGAALKLGKTELRVDDGERVTVALADGEEWAGLRGRTPLMRRLFSRVHKAAQGTSAVLLVGESGTGKELFARALHSESARRDGPFVVVDCGSLAPNLVASELFGHDKGAFTGADARHIGAFERAHGGTLFLDEVGELSRALQPALLGALERRSFRRVGGRQEVKTDVRVVCATNRDLRAEVNSGEFRLDLYYRLAVVVVQVPALRERPEDIPVLIEHFLREAGHAGPVDDVVTPDALGALLQHRWPGNVRELRNVVEATLLMGEPPTLDDGFATDGEVWLGQDYKGARAQILDDFEARFLPRLLERAGGNVSEAARLAKMDRTYLIKLLVRHGLK